MFLESSGSGVSGLLQSLRLKEHFKPIYWGGEGGEFVQALNDLHFLNYLFLFLELEKY